ncbi:MAG TPA: hypothetical protein VK915_14355 [Gaiellaceae bacterium]|nr:hypothetical protein [Gaiellaceae bacterium]
MDRQARAPVGAPAALTDALPHHVTGQRLLVGERLEPGVRASNAPAGPGFTTVATGSAPRGFCVFHAKIVIITSPSTGSDCILTYDIGNGDVEVYRSNRSPDNSSGTARTTHNLQRLLQFGHSPGQDEVPGGDGLERVQLADHLDARRKRRR